MGIDSATIQIILPFLNSNTTTAEDLPNEGNDLNIIPSNFSNKALIKSNALFLGRRRIKPSEKIEANQKSGILPQ